MSLLYHIPPEGEYRLVHCSNARDANLYADFAQPVPLLLAKIKRSISLLPGVLEICKRTPSIFAPPISISAGAMHLPNA
ncbi:hypothetical protein [Rhizobium sp. L43]|uniref:hypothetical protein n=1 Tax=Rhizobium sp. L43 TaxID=2035452 RepID=UPI001179B090|nr:hypothetical protein [Rhizobium sp. L43]